MTHPLGPILSVGPRFRGAPLRNFVHARATGADFIIRIGWRSVRLLNSSGENFNLLAATIHRLPFRVRAKPILVGVGNTDYRKKSPVGTTCQFIFPDLRGGGRVVASVATRSRNSSAPARRMLRRPPEHGNAVPRELRRALRLPPGRPIHTAGVTMDPLD